MPGEQRKKKELLPYWGLRAQGCRVWGLGLGFCLRFVRQKGVDSVRYLIFCSAVCRGHGGETWVTWIEAAAAQVFRCYGLACSLLRHALQGCEYVGGLCLWDDRAGGAVKALHSLRLES